MEEIKPIIRVDVGESEQTVKGLKKEISELKTAYMEKLEEEDILNDEISKLQDPEYLAKYAREKYLYSKDDEIIIKIED